MITLAGYNVDNPTSAPSGIGLQTSQGALGLGDYQYKITYTTQFGETLASPASAIIVSYNTILLSDIPVSDNPEVAFKKLYRTVVGGSVYKYLTILSNNIIQQYDYIY